MLRTIFPLPPHCSHASTPFGFSQADLGNAAIKVGGTVLSGTKSLGGMAYDAPAKYARSRSGMSVVTRASPYVCEDPTRRLLSTQGDQRASVMSGEQSLLSRSAPAASNGNHDHDQVHGHNHTHLRGNHGWRRRRRAQRLARAESSASGSYVYSI